MSAYLLNNWNGIRAFYREAQGEILAAGANEWGIDTYLWDGLGIIHFTPIEYALWADIRAVDAVLYPQYPVGRFFVDFGNPAAKVAIECDGAAYHADREKDAKRDAELARLGWSVYRFPGWMCKGDFDEETMEPSEAYQRMQRIAERHGIDRKSREKNEEFVRFGDDVDSLVRGLFRQAAIADAALRAARC